MFRRLPIFTLAGLLTVSLPLLADNGNDPLSTEAALLKPPQPCSSELPTHALSAIDAVDLALCRHPQTREQWANARYQAAQVGVADSAWLPSLDGRIGASRVETENAKQSARNASLSLSWLLLDGGQRQASAQSARDLLISALATRDATVQSLFLAALQAFYNAQATQAAVLAAQEAETAANESLAAAQLRHEVGVGTPADRLQAQTAASQARLNRQRADGEARNALGSLAAAMGFPAQTALKLAPLLAPLPASLQIAQVQQDIDALIASALAQRADLQAAEASLRAAEASIDVVRGQGRPSLSLSAGPAWQRMSGETARTDSIGLTLNVPIFSGFETTYRVRAAQAQRDARAAQRDRLRDQVALEVWRAYQNLGVAAQTVATTQDLLASAEQSARVALGRYKAGVGTVLDLLTAQSALASARLQGIQAQLDWHVSRATLAQAQGALDHTLLSGAKDRE